MPRQLALPGLLRPPEKPPVRAKRDLSAEAFARAIARHGFKQVGTSRFVDTRAERWRYVEAVFRVNPIRIAHRATLAKLVREKLRSTDR